MVNPLYDKAAELQGKNHGEAAFLRFLEKKFQKPRRGFRKMDE